MSQTKDLRMPHPGRIWPRLLLVLAAFALCLWGCSAWQQHALALRLAEKPAHLVAGLNLRMIWIPSGTFVMGREPESSFTTKARTLCNFFLPPGLTRWKERPPWEKSEYPPTTVTLTRGFHLGETVVTRGQWNDLMGLPTEASERNLPKTNLSWYECFVFCEKLTSQERAAGRISGLQAYRLPTEAEWEYACRARRTGDYEPRHPTPPASLNPWSELGSIKTSPVSSFEANPWGLRGMPGGIDEWCSDWYGPYPGGEVTDPTGPSTGPSRINRGLNYSARDPAPVHKSSSTGFRIVLASAP